MSGISRHLLRGGVSVGTHSLGTLIERQRNSRHSMGCLVVVVLFWVLLALVSLFWYDSSVIPQEDIPPYEFAEPAPVDSSEAVAPPDE